MAVYHGIRIRVSDIENYIGAKLPLNAFENVSCDTGKFIITFSRNRLSQRIDSSKLITTPTTLDNGLPAEWVGEV